MKRQMLFAVALLAGMQNINANDHVAQIQIGKYTFPAMLSSMLSQGFTVPVYLKFEEDQTIAAMKSQQKIADAVVEYRDNQLFARKIIFDDSTQSTELSPEVKAQIAALNQAFDDDMTLHITNDAVLSFDLQSLYIELIV